jgi:hypothetical protein
MSDKVIFEVILLMLSVDGTIHLAVAYSCFTEVAILSKSSFRIRSIENVLVPEAVAAVMVLSPLIHFFAKEITS